MIAAMQGRRLRAGTAVAGLMLVAAIGLRPRVEAQQPAAGRSAASAAPHRALVNTYCLDCHDNTAREAGLSLEAIVADDAPSHADLWEKVIRKLRTRQMPPVGEPRPDDTAYDEAIASLETSIDRAADAHPNPGRTATIRRLTRTEYHNAIRDLLDLDVDVAALLPADESSYGFDNVTVGDLSPMLLERYISAAEKISRMAVGRPSRSPGGETIRVPPDLTQEEHIDGLPIGTRGGAVVPYTFPADAEYEIQIRLRRDRDELVEGLSEAHDLELLLDRQRVQVFTVKPPQREPGVPDEYQPSQEKVDAHLKIRVPVGAGPHMIGVAFLKKPSDLLETARQPYQAHFNSYRHPRVQPAIYSVSIVGPYAAKGPGDTPSRRRIFGSRAAGHAQGTPSAGQILSTLMRRAYRRPVTPVDLKSPLALFQKARAGADFDAGVEISAGARFLEQLQWTL